MVSLSVYHWTPYTINLWILNRISNSNDVDCINSEKDLSAFWHIYQKVCDEILNTFGSDSTIHLFSAIPVSAAFEVGRRRMPGLYPRTIIYDDNGGFIPTLTIGG